MRFFDYVLQKSTTRNETPAQLNPVPIPHVNRILSLLYNKESTILEHNYNWVQQEAIRIRLAYIYVVVICIT